MWWNKFTNAQIETGIENALAGGSSLIHQASVTLNDGQIQQWPITAVELVPGLTGADLFLQTAVLIKEGSAYGNINGGSPPANASIGDDDGDLKSTFCSLQSLLAGGQHKAQLIANTKYNSFLDQDVNQVFATTAGRPLLILADNNGDGPFTDGPGTVMVILLFSVLDIAGGRFLTTDESGWDEDMRTFS